MYPIRNARVDATDIANASDSERAFVLKVLKETGGLGFDVLRTVAEVSEVKMEACLKILISQSAVQTELRAHGEGMRLFYKLTKSYLGE